MANLIDADALLKDINDYPYGYKGMIKDTIAIQPTVDAVEVVRCKDCKHRDPEDHKCDSGQLERAGCFFPVGDDYFCACGERREDDKIH